MKCTHAWTLAGLLAAGGVATLARAEEPDHMAWWREARFGLFIHWGLYSVPAGVWDGREVGGVGEWIQQHARLPVREYEPLRGRFDPVDFDADEWVSLAQRAGMRYLVITTKHHDGFALFDSADTDWDVMSTPFHRDIMKEIADACRRHGVRIGWYHSILDWHDRDYLPKRDWHETPAEGADFERYKQHLFAQVRELLTNYGPIDIMWFDGEWDDTWTPADGRALEALCRELQPDIVINNRVGKRRPGDGDFGTPEQEIPATGRPGQDWETCMTMNDTWGYKASDHNWKSVEDLLHALVDIASKGGNFLLNVGPTGPGRIPEPCVARLEAIGTWLAANGKSIYGTSASPFGYLPWGRCTQRAIDGGTRLYLHVFDWPEDGRLVLGGLANRARAAHLVAGGADVPVRREEDALVVTLPRDPLDPLDTVIALDVEGIPEVTNPPVVIARHHDFVSAQKVEMPRLARGLSVRYTRDGTVPSAASPLAPRMVTVNRTCTLTVRAFRGNAPVSGARRVAFRKADPLPALAFGNEPVPGVHADYFEATCASVSDLHELRPLRTGIAPSLAITARDRDEHFGFHFHGYLHAPASGMYTFTLSSDDGSVLDVAGVRVVDHDGLHAAYDKEGRIALAEGWHAFEVWFFENGGDESLDVWVEGPGGAMQRVEGTWLGH